MKYDSVLDQQSISGKIISLILCVWKPCYVKSGHIYSWLMQIGYFIYTNIPALFIELNCHYNKMCICAYHTHTSHTLVEYVMCRR